MNVKYVPPKLTRVDTSTLPRRAAPCGCLEVQIHRPGPRPVVDVYPPEGEGWPYTQIAWHHGETWATVHRMGCPASFEEAFAWVCGMHQASIGRWARA